MIQVQATLNVMGDTKVRLSFPQEVTDRKMIKEVLVSSTLFTMQLNAVMMTVFDSLQEYLLSATTRTDDAFCFYRFK